MFLIDTHTHFDETEFDFDRELQAQLAWNVGVRHLLLVGYVERYFQRLVDVQQHMSCLAISPMSHIAFGLHPFYVKQHNQQDLISLDRYLSSYQSIAIGEIGLDTFDKELKQEKYYLKQKAFFLSQLDMAVAYQLPVLLHIRKSHADCLRLIKSHAFAKQDLAGIAHSFSGGEQEAKAFVKLGFKLGITGQITNPNAKKLRNAISAVVSEYGIESLVIETDCPDMMPIMCQSSLNDDRQCRRNVPKNLTYVLKTLADMFQVDEIGLAEQLWKNTCEALKVDWTP